MHDNQAVKFVGGPFDGHVQPVSLEPTELAEMVLLPVNENVLRMIQGKHRGPKSVPTSVAMYELHNDDGRLCYHYWSATTPRELQLLDWVA